MLSEAQIGLYREQGYLLVENVFSAEEIATLNRVTDSFITRSRSVAQSDSTFDLAPDHEPAHPKVRRVKNPTRQHPAFEAAMRNPKLLAILQDLLGPAIRFDHAKLNIKPVGGGAAIEWHQDWAFYPHTNDDLAAVGFVLDDMTHDNGPLMVVPGSHTGPVYDHHVDGHFCGGVDVAAAGADVSGADALTGPAGSITVHHVRALHGSARNVSGARRRLLLHQYCAADAWPIGEHLDWEAYVASIVSGEPVATPRLRTAPVRLPLPAAPDQGSIYENQRTLQGRYFS